MGVFTADKGNFSVPKVVEVVHNWLHHLSVIRTYAGELAVGFSVQELQLEYESCRLRRYRNQHPLSG